MLISPMAGLFQPQFMTLAVGLSAYEAQWKTFQALKYVYIRTDNHDPR